MGQSFQILVSDTVKEKIRNWGLSAEVEGQMRKHLLEELAADPSTHLTRCIAPWLQLLNLYAFTVIDESGLKHLFQFHCVYSEDETAIKILDCGHATHKILDGEDPLPTA